MSLVDPEETAGLPNCRSVMQLKEPVDICERTYGIRHQAVVLFGHPINYTSMCAAVYRFAPTAHVAISNNNLEFGIIGIEKNAQIRI